VVATKAVLISTVDVYENPNGVTEEDPPNFDGAGAYGVHRAWFEAVFRYTFPEALIVRLPALFAADLKKNLVYDLLNHKQEQWRMVNPNSKFQYFDVSRTWEQIEKALDANLKLLNLSVEPVSAQEIANLFKVELSGESIAVHYDVRSVHSDDFGGRDGYLFDKSHALSGISKLQRGVSR
jgi:dTDP-4-dehydrorhamnose reductase